MKKYLFVLLGVLLINTSFYAQPSNNYNLVSTNLPTRWDEAFPMGNGRIGLLVYEKNNKLRFSLDRADLWDERATLKLEKNNFQWVIGQVQKKEYDTVQRWGDDPYEAFSFPTKLPAAAIEFSTGGFGKPIKAELNIKNGICKIEWPNGIRFQTFVHTEHDYGVFSFEGVSKDFIPELVAPKYGAIKKLQGNSVSGQGLEQLGYEQGIVTEQKNQIQYLQKTAQGHSYLVTVKWHFANGRVNGCWSILKDPDLSNQNKTITTTDTAITSHIKSWDLYWKASSIHIPDTSIEKQYYRELYKLKCVAAKNAPAITLQAIWTADNGNLPPWKGDFHNDLNTQLSYWPTYTANHLSEAATFTDWLWQIREANKKYTQQYFGVKGLNVPGVATLHGDAMGGWIQYSLSPTVAAWLSQHFYWQWKYSMDKIFLSNRAYPYIQEVALFLENITTLKNGKRALPISASPEIFNNSLQAWFLQTTNYDLSLIRYAFTIASETAAALNKKQEAAHWLTLADQLPALDTDETGLTIAPGFPNKTSHRHHSNLMAIYPLGLLDIDKPNDKSIIQNSLRHMEKLGTRQWCGYSFSWAACLYARAKEGEKAKEMLNIFANNFCSVNSFHLNGDQKGGEYSNFTYRPFTLEGNFAFAQGLHEMLIQNKEGVIEVFPAIPAGWKSVSFDKLRTEGAILVSALQEKGHTKNITLTAQASGLVKLKLPSSQFVLSNSKKKYSIEKDILLITLKEHESISIELK